MTQETRAAGTHKRSPFEEWWFDKGVFECGIPHKLAPDDWTTEDLARAAFEAGQRAGVEVSTHA